MAAKKTDEGKKRPAKASGKGNTVKSGNKKSSKRMEDSNITKEADHVMDEVFLVITLLVSLLLILSYVHLCGPIGEFLNFITFGFMGVIAYVFPFLLFFAVAFSLSNRGNKMANRRIYSGIGLFFVLAALIQLISGYEPEISVFGYFKQCGEGQSGGGFAGSILLKLFYKSFGEVATALILIALALIFFMLLTGKTIFSYFKEMRKITGMNSRRMQEEEEYIEEYEEETLPKRRSAKIVTLHKSSELAENVQAGTAPEGEAKPKKEPQSFIDALKNIGKKGRTENRKQDFNKQEQGGSLQETEVISKEDKKLSQGKYDMEEILPDSSMDRISITGSYMQEKADSSANLYEEELKRKFGDADKKTEVIPEKAEDFADDLFPAEAFEESRDADAGERLQGNEDIEKDKRGDTHTPVSEHTKEKAQKQPTAQGKNTETADFSDIGISPVTEPVKPYVFPPIDLLGKPPAAAKGMTERDLKETAFKLQSTLDSFGVKVSITNVSCGPAVTRYELSPEQGVKVSKITSLSDDIKLNLAASDIRIEAPISGKAAVGIEVPNKEVSPVFFRELIEHADFKAHPSDVAFGVGKDIGGQVVVTDIAKMPHLLIAGATGSGKSVCINTLIMSILYKSKPSDVRLIMIDPKVVELSVYNGIPHLLIPVVTDPKKASAALNWAVMEMTDRYNKFAELGVRDLKGYNAKVAEIEDLNDPKYQKMPQMVIIVDELADLMMVASSEVETAICRLAQMARAAGMHLIIATQRPSVNVITGVIKANVPSRIAFSVSSAIDSRTIIDSSGAESLLGKGDMLFFPSGIPKPVRVQGAFVSDKEVSAVVEFLKTQNESTSYNAQVNEQIANAAASSMTELSASSGGNERDDYFIEAGKFIIEKEKASIGMLQRIYKIGFNRAARIMDQLADAGVVGPEEGTKPRKILMTMEEFEQYVDEYV